MVVVDAVVSSGGVVVDADVAVAPSLSSSRRPKAGFRATQAQTRQAARATRVRIIANVPAM